MSPPYTQVLSVLQRGHLGFDKGRPVAAVLLYRYAFWFDKHSLSAIGSSEREGLAMGHRGWLSNSAREGMHLILTATHCPCMSLPST